MMTTADALGWFIGILGTLAAIVFAYVAYARGKSKDDHEEGKTSGTVLTEIGYIKANTDDIKHRQEKWEDNHLKVVERLSAVESSAKSAHHRIDTIEDRIAPPDGR